MYNTVRGDYLLVRESYSVREYNYFIYYSDVSFSGTLFDLCSPYCNILVRDHFDRVFFIRINSSEKRLCSLYKDIFIYTSENGL